MKPRIKRTVKIPKKNPNNADPNPRKNNHYNYLQPAGREASPKTNSHRVQDFAETFGFRPFNNLKRKINKTPVWAERKAFTPKIIDEKQVPTKQRSER